MTWISSCAKFGTWRDRFCRNYLLSRQH